MSRQLFEYHPVIGYRFIPGLRARVPHENGGYLVRTNGSGFRCDREFTGKPAPGTQRVLLFGDSFTAGEGVSNGQRFGDVLEQRVAGMEVFNFGLPGTGTDQQYLAYQQYGRDLEHDIMILAVQVENVRRVGQRYRPFESESGEVRYFAKPYYELVGGELAVRHVPPDPKPFKAEELPAEARQDTGGHFASLRWVVNTIGARDLAQKLTRYQPVPEYDDPANPSWSIMRRLVVEWISNHRKPVLLMPLPLYHHVEGMSSAAAYQERFREIAAETGCLLHDPLPHLMSFSAEERRGFRFRKDLHPTPTAHAAIADSLAGAIRPVLAQELKAHLKPLPDGRGSAGSTPRSSEAVKNLKTAGESACPTTASQVFSPASSLAGAFIHSFSGSVV